MIVDCRWDDLVDNCNSEEIQRLTCFAQMPNVVDVENICVHVKSQIADMLAAVEKSANSANMLQLEKMLNSSYSLFLVTKHNGSSPQSPSPTNNAPVSQDLFRWRENMTEWEMFILSNHLERRKEDIMEKYRELSKQ